MCDFESIHPGSRLMVRRRSFGREGWGPRSPFAMEEWVELVVEKVSPKFYFVGGEKYRKDDCGRNFMPRHFIPGQDGAPNRGNTEDFERSLALYAKLTGLQHAVLAKLEKLTLEDAAQFADEIKHLEARIDAAVAEAPRD